MSEQVSTTPVSESNDRQRMIVGLGVLAGIVLVIIVAVVILLFVDPFGWDLLGTAGKDAAVEAVPTDSLMYLHLDLGSLKDENLEAIVRALSPEPLEEDMTFFDQQMERLDEILTEELNMTYSEDIQPWIGNDFGLSVSDLMSGLSGGSEEESILVVVGISDEKAADEFLEQLVAELETRSGGTVQDESYENQTIYYIENGIIDKLAICHSGNHMLIGGTVKAIQNGIDAQNGESLADLEGYQDGVGALPDDTMLTMYLDMAKYQENLTPLLSSMYGSGMTELVSESSSAASVVAMGVSAVDVGVKVDYAIIADPELQAEMPEGYFNDDPKTASLAPEDTILYFTSGIAVDNLEQTKESLLGLLSSQGGDAEEALMMFAMAFGFDPIEDLLGNLNGELAVMLLPSSEGVLAESMEIPLGFAILAETDNSSALLDVADKLSTALEKQGMGVAEVSEQDFGTIYDLVDMYYGDLIVTYGVSEDHLMIGSSSGVLEEVFSGGLSLADSEGYQEVWDAFSRGMAPVMYVNIEGLIGQIRESMEPWERETFDEEVGEIVESLRFLAAAASPMDDNIARATFILFMEME